jgi:hypothetical protein
MAGSKEDVETVLVAELQRSGFVVMRRPRAELGPATGRGFEV